MSLRLYLVTLRGEFGELDDATRRRLLLEAPSHDGSAEFSRNGTFTYDTALDSFSFRFEIRVGEDADPAEVASKNANAYLSHHGIACRGGLGVELLDS